MFYGCITAVVLALVLGIGGFFAVRHWMGKLVEVVLEKTETTPMPLPSVAAFHPLKYTPAGGAVLRRSSAQSQSWLRPSSEAPAAVGSP